MQSEATDFLFSQEQEGDYHRPQEEEENLLQFFQEEEGDHHRPQEAEENLLKKTVKQLNLVDEEDTVAYHLRGGQSQINVRELRSKGLSFQIWPAAHALCWYLEEMFAHTGMLNTPASQLPMPECSTLKQNMRVLELGAGTGMVGIVCAVLGGHCTITDLPHVTSNLEYNSMLNQEAIHRSGRGGSVVVKPLRWGERSDVEAVGHSFDLIVASDVVYYDHLFEPLLSTLKWLLYSPSRDGITASTATRTTAMHGVTIFSYGRSEEGATPATCMSTEKPIADEENLSLKLPSITKNTAILEEITEPVSGDNGATRNGMHLAKCATTSNGMHLAEEASIPAPTPASNALSMPVIREDTTPVVLLAHLRRWKKDSHFFKKASKLFHVTIVHKHSHEANTRTGVTVYSISRKK